MTGRLTGCIPAAICIAVSIVAPSPASAGACGYDYCWGALAVGPNGARGRASGKRTAPGAAGTAMRHCGSECRYEVFYNACGAMAGSHGGQPAFGWGAQRHDAELRALKACEASGARCWIVDWVCSH